MTSSTDKERARRDEIEAAYVHPEPLVPKHVTTDDERPRTAKTIKAAIPDGFGVEEWSATVYDFPRWRRTSPDDPHLSFIADEIVVYHLAALRPLPDLYDSYPPGVAAAVEVMYLNGRPAKSWVGVGRGEGKGVKMHLPVIQVAKTLRELVAS
jgi:hypothetical protein